MAKRKAKAPARLGGSSPSKALSKPTAKKATPQRQAGRPHVATSDATCEATVLGSESTEAVVVLCRLKCQVTGTLPNAEAALPVVCTIGCTRPNSPDSLSLHDARQNGTSKATWRVHVRYSGL